MITYVYLLFRRRLNTRVSEMTEQYESEHARVLTLERTKTQLTGQIHEIQMSLDSVWTNLTFVLFIYCGSFFVRAATGALADKGGLHICKI